MALDLRIISVDSGDIGLRKRVVLDYCIRGAARLPLLPKMEFSVVPGTGPEV